MPSVKSRRSPLILLLLVALWSASIGWLASGAWAQDSELPDVPDEFPYIGTVDPIPENKRAGQTLYLGNCAGCHIAIPPALLPTETWRDNLLDEDHYGAIVPVLPSPQIEILWDYLQFFSRPNPSQNETQAFRLDSSTFFTAMHPGMAIERPVRLDGCASCHPGANDFDFRRTQETRQAIAPPIAP
ncbi:MAG: diheme cytochrome C [Geitlerinemataceae cyanobacterium]